MPQSLAAASWWRERASPSLESIIAVAAVTFVLGAACFMPVPVLVSTT